jgi:hypothetical protein
MFTFLPEEYKDRAVRKYHLKLVIVYIGLSCVLFATGFVFAIPSYAILFAKRNAALTEKQTMSASADRSIADEVKILKEEIALAASASQQVPVARIFDKILSRQTPGILISGISIKRGEETGTITLEGKATSRDVLVVFSKALQGEPSFTNVDLPVGSLAKSKDIPWAILITTKF